jgi:hypothetical protein
MRSIRFAALGIVVAAFAAAPASAATRHKHHAAPVQSEPVDEGLLSAPVASRAMPAPNWLTPNACISDEGYGRYSSCDGGTSN